jgi:hypothetical protein
VTGVPFDDLLIAIERDPNDASDKLRNAIRDGSCSMDEAMTGLREVAADADRARNPAVVKHHVGEIANGLRFADMAGFNDWVVRHGSVLGQGVIKYMPDEPEKDCERPTVMGILKRVFLGRA